MSKLLVGRYELVEKIGEGGMAVVYKSRDRLLNRYVAIKILRPEFTKDAQFVESFKKESQAAAGLQHPNIISVYDVGREGNIHFIVMELINGKPLSDVIKEQAPMDYKRCIEITKQVAAALSVAHKNNIIHRDIKPHNIMITEEGMAKLGDFGIAKAVSDSTLTETSKIIGSVHYFSPEQARGAYVDERSDLYSLGIVLYEMLTGQVPFDGDNPVQVALMHINDDVTPPSKLVPGIPPALEKLVMKATDKFQSNRYRSADEMLEDLDNIEFVTKMVGDSVFAADDVRDFQESNRRKQAEAPVAKAVEETAEKKVKKKSKKPLIIVLAVLVALAALFGILYASGIIGGGFSFGKVTVPDVSDLSYSEAKTTLENEGLKAEKGDTVTSDSIEKGKVAGQNPAANSKVSKGTVVTLNISSGKSTGQIPNLVGKPYDQDDISSYVKSMGFVLGSVDYAKSDKYDKGYIISQTPSAGSEQDKDTSIDIVVCNGKKTTKATVPSLTGLTVDEAKSKITGQNFVVGSVTYEESTVYGEGYVMWQQYDAGTSLKVGSSISIKVSKGAPSSGDDDSTDSN
ncbi:Stk1 family PASTA domain-containing Ser/Thr kinase [Aminicella lysinilytica]|uniref:Stk1 family PASTA domain-containing Ser/Thr kinase n=1 Tax=Aminicella lysinilytica TaxID=433323 RepID=UPI0026EA5508|nr:Stk1 family PASTA domain-containing Ser/Thr kinase [Aminicella lysinilytica]